MGMKLAVRMAGRPVMAILLVLSLLACGGGGGAEDTAAPAQTPASPSRAAALANICAPENPFANLALPALRTGSLADEQAWMRSFLQERYLWYRELQTPDPQAPAYRQLDDSGRLQVFESLQAYFDDQLSPRQLPSGRRLDRFSFMIDTERWNRFGSGQSLGFGWLLRHDSAPGTGGIRVAHVYPQALPGLAFTQGVARGDRILSVNGVALAGLDEERLVALLEPLTPGWHSFVIEPQAAPGQTRSVTLTAQNLVLPQAEFRTVRAGDALWAYLLFNSHVESAEPVLLQAMAHFRRAGIDEMVLDLRYNAGGYLAVASALARAIAGDARTRGRVFEQTRFNDQRSDENFSLAFLDATLFSGQAYETLNLSRLYVLTSGETCSASESLINGLRGVDLEVVLIGAATCGKPYGFYPQDNCGITYAALEFEGVNDKGEGGFAEGLQPGCLVQDDLSYPLGQPQEPLFAAAIAHRQSGRCNSPAGLSLLDSGRASLGGLATSTPWPQSAARRSSLLRADWQRNKFSLPR